MRKLYIKNFKKKRTLTISEFIDYLFTDCPSTYTITSKHAYRLQCHRRRARSFHDIIRIVKTYFPRANKETILRAIHDNLVNYNEDVIYRLDHDDPGFNQYRVIIYCPDISKLVVQHTWGIYGIPEDQDDTDAIIRLNLIVDYDHYASKYKYKKINGISLVDFLKINDYDNDIIEELFD